MEEPLPRSQSPTDELIASRVIAIIRTDDAARILPLARAIIDGGIRAIEISLTSPGALDAIARLSTEVPAGTMVGAGTVLSAAQAEAAIRAGSRFLFSPSFNAEVLGIAQVHRIPFIPAALTPTEVLSLFRQELHLIKLFPAGSLGAGYLRDLLGPLPELPRDPNRRHNPRKCARLPRCGCGRRWRRGRAYGRRDRKRLSGGYEAQRGVSRRDLGTSLALWWQTAIQFRERAGIACVRVIGWALSNLFRLQKLAQADF
jgi:2-dehydro-3-deoxyphosphogluconate aldolase/(4S)-4-hydroxy-2-oxoglutarate aldolase